MKIFKRIGLIALAICLGIGSLFITMPQKSNKYASADVTYFPGISFVSSDIIYSATAYSSTYSSNFNDIVDNSLTNNIASNSILNYSFRFSLDNASSSDFSMNIGVKGFYNSDYGLINNPSNSAFFMSSDGYLSFLPQFSRPSASSSDYAGLYIPCLYKFGNTGTYYTCLGFVLDFSSATEDLPSLVIETIELGSSKDNFVRLNYYNSSNNLSLSFKDCNIVCYTDSHGFKFIYYIPSYFDASSIPQFFLSYRKYYTSNAFDFSNNSYYQQGLSDGYSNGYSSGEDYGYETGSREGYQQGFQAGRIDGIESSSEYTFLGLIGAVIDAPVSVFKTMFNFNLLGVNMRDFFLSLLTFSFILVAVKFIFMRK